MSWVDDAREVVESSREWLAERLGGIGKRTGTELAAVGVVAALGAGVLVGSGVGRTAMDVADGMTWLSDSPNGEIVQVNPATGLPELRLGVGADGDDIVIAQQDGRLVVLNRTTGQVTSFDLATLLASGQRQERGKQDTKVLMHDDAVYVLDRKKGTVSRVDPVTLQTLGEVHRADGGITDAAVDGEGVLWVLDAGGELVSLTWSAETKRFIRDDARTIEGAGGRSRLVAHKRGVTVFGPDRGIVVRHGTGDDLAVGAPGLRGQVEVAQDSPADLVPASATGAGLVVLVSGDQVREVNVKGLGCGKPGAPAVFHGRVYVPCLGDRKVIQLDRNGHRAGADIRTPNGGEPELVSDDGRLLVNVPGAERGVELLPDGGSRSFRRGLPEVKATPTRPTLSDVGDVEQHVRQLANEDRRKDRQRSKKQQRWTPPETKEKRSSPHQGEREEDDGAVSADPTTSATAPGGGGAEDPVGDCTDTETDCTGDPAPDPCQPQPVCNPDPDPTDDPGTEPTDPGTEPTTEPTTDPPTEPAPKREAPANVTATANANGSVTVRWSHNRRSDREPCGCQTATSFTVHRADNDTRLATLNNGDARQATVTGLPTGTSVRVVVRAHFSGGTSTTSAPSDPVTPYGAPGAVSNIRGSETSRTSSDVTVRVSWNAAAANGSTITEYQVVTTYDSGRTYSVTVGGSATSATVTLPCGAGSFCDGGSGRSTVTARNSAGSGPSASGNWSVNVASTPQDGDTVITSASGRGNTSGSTTANVSLSPPQRWASFGGTCTIHGGANPVRIACSDTSASVPIDGESYMYCRGSNLNYTFYVNASGAPAGSADSASYTFQVYWPGKWENRDDCIEP